MLQNPPTDNLYKFITFLGVALIIFSAWTYIENTRKIQVAVLTAEFEMQSLRSQAEILEGEVKGADNEASMLHRQLKDPAQRPDPGSAEFARIESRVEQLKVTKAESEKTLKSIKQRFNEINEKISNANITAKSLDSQNIILLISFGFGCIMATLGFSFWYFKHQRHQDELLKISTQKSDDS
ncbi:MULTISPECIES: hypothetical protein [Brucella]|uniref:Uncharacterized protein n=2 Tax=Brucella TaxID=234 RepID=A0A6L3YB54_9HYPH|nr:hypothetical protein [Brucella tritici]KAB2674188.1 hypothetical protein F9L08_28800 [Brucella tritici]